MTPNPGLSLVLDDEALDHLADALAARLAARQSRPSDPQSEDRWMGSADAADYLGLSKDALHKLTAREEIPFSQAKPRAKLYFQKSALDHWRLANAVGPDQ